MDISKLFKTSKYLKVEGDEQRGRIHVEKPATNMQTDAACFEAVALLLKAKCREINLEISFEWVNWTGRFENLNSGQAHYMRFLYRIMRFTEGMDWCTLDAAASKEVARFLQAICRAKATNNVPESEATYNPAKGKEHTLENQFVLNGGEYLSRLLIQQGGNPLTFIDHQLPNGLFDGDIKEKNRIFPTGYFDLWGINGKNEFCLFELKTNDNTKMGMLSELYFYAEYTAEFLLDCEKINQKSTSKRSYDKLLREVQVGCSRVNAYFLVGEKTHSEIVENKAEVLKLLNGANPNIQYQFLVYDEGKIL